LPLLYLGVSIFRRRASIEITLLDGRGCYTLDGGPESGAAAAETTAAVGGDGRWCYGATGPGDQAGNVACCYASSNMISALFIVTSNFCKDVKWGRKDEKVNCGWFSRKRVTETVERGRN